MGGEVSSEPRASAVVGIFWMFFLPHGNIASTSLQKARAVAWVQRVA
jgi:hypothetical protein